jgi:hypothetical protein
MVDWGGHCILCLASPGKEPKLAGDSMMKAFSKTLFCLIEQFPCHGRTYSQFKQGTTSESKNMRLPCFAHGEKRVYQ